MDCSVPVNCGCHRRHHRPPQARRFVAPSPALSEPQGASGLFAQLVSSLFEKSRLKQCSGWVFSAMTQFDVKHLPVRLRTAIGAHVRERKGLEHSTRNRMGKALAACCQITSTADVVHNLRICRNVSINCIRNDNNSAHPSGSLHWRKGTNSSHHILTIRLFFCQKQAILSHGAE